MSADLPFSDACERNKEPILQVLKEFFPPRGFALEIGSGTGQHAVHFAKALTAIRWQPSDISENIPGLKARIEAEGSDNILPPIELDVHDDSLSSWPERVLTAAFSANTAHIMSWDGVRAMFTGMGKKLKPRGVFCLYGPFNVDGRYTADSNRLFDLELKSQSPEMGLRDVKTLETLAKKNDLELIKRVQMPANNQVLVFRKNDAKR